jgi:organic hydroperoxide reductase OsmC/OhrA
MTTTKEEAKLVNGVRVDKLFATIDAIKETPAIADFKFRAHNKWVNGGHNHITVTGFYGAQEEHSHEKPFEFDADEPPLLLGEDIGANPVEYLLTALSACLTTAMSYHAAAKGIELKGVESRYEGDLDLRG